ncbi:hypothetical protein [Pontibacter harenae]|uniref:hypothetical protein n=1 Tax=Pontibacter harenae TaxID=2894083 RepID=UPI001E464444|nr:hypothetical protein [Pontibacter harenae]MCC9166545.1 hypothetical protein [Pontibacter harenae]
MEEAQHLRSKETIKHLYDKILPALAERINTNLEAVTPLFHDFKLERMLDTWTSDPQAEPDVEISMENGNVQLLGLKLRLEGFQRAGVQAFDISKDLVFKLERHSYEVKPDKQNVWLTKQYLQPWPADELEEIAEKWCEQLIDNITEKLQNLS